MLKPDKKSREQPLLSETEMTRLQRLAQRQSLDNMADFFVQVAALLGAISIATAPASTLMVMRECDASARGVVGRQAAVCARRRAP